MSESSTDFESLLKYVNNMYEEMIPFNKLLQLEVVTLKEDDVCLRIDMREELIGNFTYKILHGGVISSILDVTGGAVSAIGALKRMVGKPPEEIAKKMSKLGTIDLRVDYLRPGKGNYFLSTGSVMRLGNKVVVTRMSLHNDENSLIAVGTGTYMLG
jgi:uncharacterized protein (TIGR00369 family)